MLFVITNSQICKNNFIDRIEKIAKSKPDRIILREKQLSEKEYEELAVKCYDICKKYEVSFSVNTFIDVAERLSIPDIHIPLYILENNASLVDKFNITGVSVHSVDEAVKAEKLGASYIIAGHIFATDCKKGLEPRGIRFLEEVKSSVNIPVLAIGGITSEKVHSVIDSGADGICVMSHFMKCDDVGSEILKFR